MPAGLSVTTVKQQTVKLEPALKRKLLTDLRTYENLHESLQAIKHAMEKAKGSIEESLMQTGETSIELEGFKVSYVCGTTTPTLDKKEFVAKGGDLALYNECCHSKPKKPYTLVTVPSVITDSTSEEG